MATRKEKENVEKTVEGEATTTKSVTSEETPEIKLTAVYEKTFDEPIVDVIFDTATVSIGEATTMGWKEAFLEKMKDREALTYPSVLITNNEIKFLEVNGKKKKSISRIVEGVEWKDKQGTHIGEGKIKVSKSKNGKYLALAIPKEGSSLGEGEKGNLVIYEKDGKELWRIENVYLSNGYIVPSPNGKYAISLPPEEYRAGFPYYYSEKGNVELKVKRWEDGWKKGYAVSEYAFSENGDYLIMGGFNTHNYGEPFILMFDANGNNLWVKMCKYGINDLFFVNDSYIIVSQKQPDINKCNFSLLKISGEIVWESKEVLPFGDYGYYIDNKRELKIAFGIKGRNIYHNYLYGVNLANGKIEQIVKVEMKDRLKRILLITGNTIYVEGEKNIYQIEAVRSKSPELKVLFKGEEPLISSNLWQGKIGLVTSRHIELQDFTNKEE
jgi:hypothetical protein